MLFDDGLDTIELVMAAEETFQVKIPDRDAERLSTAGELSDYIVKAISATAGTTTDRCLSAAAFFEARQHLAPAFGVDRRSIHPDTQIEQLLAPNELRADWQKLSTILGVRLPPLEFPHWLLALPVCVLAVGIIVGLVVRDVTPVLCAIAGMVLIVFTLAFLERRFGKGIPRNCKTIGQISALLIPKVLASRKPSLRDWSDEEVWQVVRHLIAHYAGVSPKQVSRHTNFIRDFI